MSMCSRIKGYFTSDQDDSQGAGPGPPKVVEKLARTFSVMADPSRIRIIFALSQKEMCVGDLALFVGMSRSAVSHQLRVLKDLDLVRFYKDGRRTIYRLQDKHIENLFAEGLRHVREKMQRGI